MFKIGKEKNYKGKNALKTWVSSFGQVPTHFPALYNQGYRSSMSEVGIASYSTSRNSKGDLVSKNEYLIPRMVVAGNHLNFVSTRKLTSNIILGIPLKAIRDIQLFMENSRSYTALVHSKIYFIYINKINKQN